MLTSSQKDTPKYNPVIKGRKLKDPDMLCENVLINGADKYQKFAMWGNYLMRVAACKVTTVRTNQLVCVQLSEPFVLCLFKSSPPSHARRKRKLHSLMQLTGTMEMRQTDAAPTICCSFFILEPQLPAFFFSFSREGKRAGLVINMLLNLYSRQQILHVGPTIPWTHSLILRLRKHTSLLANI